MTARSRTYEDVPIEKIYWSIGEVADQFNVEPSLLRFWETEFPAYMHPKKNRKGNRAFTQEDIDMIRIIHDLVKVQGYTLWGAKQQLSKMILPK